MNIGANFFCNCINIANVRVDEFEVNKPINIANNYVSDQNQNEEVEK